MDQQIETNPLNYLDHNNDQGNEDDIIDVTGQSAVIVYDRDVSAVIHYPAGVPTWAHQYIYSTDELRTGTPDQVQFYQHFKKSFLSGTNLDLEGNTNYAFTLLFDLLKDYNAHKELPRLEKQIIRLISAYSKTRPQGLSSLSLVMEEQGDQKGIGRIREFQYAAVNDYGLKLGNKYRKKLNLSEREVDLLNRIWYPDNNFCNIEFCLTETVKLFLLMIAALDHRYRKEGTVVAVEFHMLADLVTHRKLGAGMNNYNYKYTILSALNNIYTLIFKYTENAVRDAYAHTRKLNVDVLDPDADILELYESKLISKLKLLFPVWINRIEQPDETTEIELFTRNTARWKVNFQLICDKFGKEAKQFYKQVLDLAKLNHQNPSVEMIYFEAAKFIARQDKIIALSLYIHHIHVDLNSSVFDNRSLNKTVQKNLFSTGEQLADFEHIVNELIRDKDLEKALTAVEKLYQPKRKKILLDPDAISQISEKHSGTVELLNRYLDDETEAEPVKMKSLIIPTDEVAIRITPIAQVRLGSLFQQTLLFSAIQLDVLELFRKGNLTIPVIELESFAKQHGAFKNQLIDRINEICYDLLDDILIEEEEENYIINENYYQNLLAT